MASGPASISGSTLTINGAGLIWLKATQAATASYAAASAKTSFSVAPAAPMLSFVTIPNQIFGTTAYAKVTTNSQGAVTYSVVSGPATVSGNAITFTGIGTVQLSASQAAVNNYTAGAATTTFNVSPRTPVLTFAALPSTLSAGSSLTVSATSASSAPVSYAVISGPATVSGSTVALTAPGWVKLSSTQPAAGNYTSASAAISFYVSAH